MVLFFIGKIDCYYTIVVIIILIICLLIVFDRLGVLNRSVIEIESLPVTIYRIVINDDFFRLFDEPIQSEKNRV